jgi:hypothetical protein
VARGGRPVSYRTTAVFEAICPRQRVAEGSSARSIRRLLVTLTRADERQTADAQFHLPSRGAVAFSSTTLSPRRGRLR